MFSSHLQEMSKSFNFHIYGDWEEVTVPKIKDMIYLLIEGQIIIISDERTLKHAKTEVRRVRWKKKKAADKLEEDIKRGLVPDPNDPEVRAAKKALEERNPSAERDA